MNVELVAQMFKNYQSNVLFHLEGPSAVRDLRLHPTDQISSNGQFEGPIIVNLNSYTALNDSLSATKLRFEKCFFFIVRGRGWFGTGFLHSPSPWLSINWKHDVPRSTNRARLCHSLLNAPWTVSHLYYLAQILISFSCSDFGYGILTYVLALELYSQWAFRLKQHLCHGDESPVVLPWLR